MMVVLCSVFFCEVDFETIVDGCPLGVCDDLDERALSVGFVLRGLQDDCYFVSVQQNQAPDGNKADTIDEEFHQYGVEGLSALGEHNLQDVRR